MFMTIEGLSCFGSFGFGEAALLAALRNANPAGGGLGVDTSALARYVPARALRQCDHLSRMALLGAYAAVDDAGLALSELEHCGIVLASGYGPATPTFDFLDSLLDYGEAMASPLSFSHSVQNIPAAVIAKIMQLIGPCATVCQLESSVASGLLLARTWLYEGRVERVLFGALDEVTPTLATTTRQRILERPLERLGQSGGRRERPLGEGAVFFMLSRQGGAPRGRIESVTLEYTGNSPENIDPQEGFCFLSGAYCAVPGKHSKTLDGSVAYGNIPIAPAFDCVAALALLRETGTHKRVLCFNYGSGVSSTIALTGAIHEPPASPQST